MALSAQTAWECRPTNGSDVFSGAFVAGATGTDFSQQNNKNIAGNNISTTDAVANGTTTITSATAAFTSAIVGNIVYFQGGTGTITAQWRQVTVFTNATTITIDATIAASTGMTMNIGGALKTLAQVSSIYVTSNKIFFKAEATQTTAATLTFATGATGTATVPPTRIIGYTTTRGDGGRGTLQLITNVGLTAFNLTAASIYLENFNIDCNSLGTSSGIGLSTFCMAINCKVSNFGGTGITTNGIGSVAVSCEVTGGVSGSSRGICLSSSPSFARWCWIHDNLCSGIFMNSGSSAFYVVSCLITNNTGASSDGVQLVAASQVIHCTIYGSGRDGIRGITTSAFDDSVIRGNILAKNGGYGMNGVTAAWAAHPSFDGNAYWSNTSGTRNLLDDTTSNAIDGVAPYTNVFDVVITGTDPTNDPFVNKAANDFRLNATAGAGALLRGTFANSFIPGAGLVSKEDFGCYQHADPAASGGGTPVLQSGIIQGLGAI